MVIEKNFKLLEYSMKKTTGFKKSKEELFL